MAGLSREERNRGSNRRRGASPAGGSGSGPLVLLTLLVVGASLKCRLLQATMQILKRHREKENKIKFLKC